MRRALVSLLALVLVACGAAPHEATVSSPPQVRAEPNEPLDWAMLLPIDTAGFLRLDLARLRRSPHRHAILPLFDELLADIENPALRQAIASVFERTELVLFALLSENADGERRLLFLARGDYREDELEQLETSAGGDAVSIELSGQRVWISRSTDDSTAAAQLRPDVIAVTDTEAEMERIIARTRMTDRSPRWPPSIRTLVEASELEQATIGVAMAGAGFAGGEGPFFSLAGRADLDGPLDIELLADLGNVEAAAMFAAMFEGVFSELARRGEGDFLPLRQLVDRVQVEANGPRVRASMRADRESSDRIVPALLELFRDELGTEDPALPTPL